MGARNELQGIRGQVMSSLAGVPNTDKLRDDLADAIIELAVGVRLERQRNERCERIRALRAQYDAGQITEAEYYAAVDADPAPTE